MALSLGLIGLGEVAQLIHLPILSRLGDLFAVAAAYDPSPSVLATVADRWDIARRHPSVEALLADPGIDAVMVLSPDQHHGEHARAALAAGKHVFLEKPACLTRADLEALAAVRSDKTVMVGYMRRFAPAFTAAKAAMPPREEITYVRVRDVICEGPWFFRQTDSVVTPKDDISADLIATSRALRASMLAEVCGPDAPADLQTAYQVLTGLSSHSLSAMRDILGGSPKRVVAAEVKLGGMQITALLDYGHFNAIYECMIGDVVRFEAGMEINTRNRRISFEYPTPYIRNLPMWTDLQDSTETGNRLTRLGPFHQDPFDVEMRAFHALATQGATNPTPPADSLADLDLFGEIIAAAKRSRA
ncbi:Gfo/Idh/MocA family protein [Oryzibacter oryziterrae]|uniref:Gfo/Idh/MocA family protein n=1 Tax=Oryzibacter oryziterrae TaxID=2766474 RepID=UPI001F2C0822|nr:Gfo/Idh/MocA family oxidoreductase [Oryzibacter oryziterrae]